MGLLSRVVRKQGAVFPHELRPPTLVAFFFPEKLQNVMLNSELPEGLHGSKIPFALIVHLLKGDRDAYKEI
jgi:hypothetical protein